MSRILEAYQDILEHKHRFVDETFYKDEYRDVCPQLTIVDAGAYEGDFSFYCYNFAKKIYAFEPDPVPFANLKRLVSSYEMGDVIQISNSALAAEDGERIFHASGGGGSRLLGPEAIEYPQEEKIKVNTLSLGTLFKENNIDVIDIFKVDIEDGENELFTSEDFNHYAPRIHKIIGEHLEGVRSHLLELGYKEVSVRYPNTIYERS